MVSLQPDGVSGSHTWELDQRRLTRNFYLSSGFILNYSRAHRYKDSFILFFKIGSWDFCGRGEKQLS